MGKARSKSSRKRRSLTSSSLSSAKVDPVTSNNNNNIHDSSNVVYESFRISRSRSRGRVETPGLEETEIVVPAADAAAAPTEEPPKIPKAESLEDLGNPLGNAVDFCVNGITRLPDNVRSIDVQKVLSLACLEDLFLCNDLLNKTIQQSLSYDGDFVQAKNTLPLSEDTLVQEDAVVVSSSKKEKNGKWKKTLKIMPGKKFLRSMSLKRGKKEDDLWKGIADEDDIEFKGGRRPRAVSDSSEDTLFTNLEGEDETWTTVAESPQPTYTEDSGDNMPVPFGLLHSKSEETNSLTSDKGVISGDCTNICLGAAALCALGSTLPATEADPVENGELVTPRNFDTKASGSAPSPEISILPLPAGGPEAGAPPPVLLTSVTKEEPCDGEDRVELEMILDDSRSIHRRWSKITPWKKIEFGSRRSGSRPRSFSRTRSFGRPRSSSRERSNTSLGEKPDETAASPNQNAEEDLELVLEDASKHRHSIIEPRTSSSAMVSQRSARVLRKRRLQAALLGLAAKSRGQKSSTSSISKPKRRSSWMSQRLVVAMPRSRSSRASALALAENTEPNTQETLPRRTTRELSTKSSIPSNSGDTLEYSESSDEDKSGNTPPTANTTGNNKITVKDLSSTSVMGLHEWSWGVFHHDPKEGEDHGSHDLEDDEEPKDAITQTGGAVVALFGGGDDPTFSTEHDASYISGEDETYFTNHDGWIMDEEQLVSFEDDDEDTHNNDGDSYTRSSSHDDIDKEFRAAIGAAGSSPEDSTKPSKSKKSKSPRRSREAFLAAPKTLSKSIRKSFLLRKKKKESSTIDLSSDISVNASSTTAASETMGASSDAAVEAVLTTGGKPDTSTTTIFEDRDDGHTTGPSRAPSTSKRGSLANSGAAFSRAKKFWSLQGATKSRDGETTTPFGKKQQRGLRKSPSEYSSESSVPSLSNVITVVTNPNKKAGLVSPTVENRTRSNDFLDRYTSLVPKDGESSSTSSPSPSWARDDQDTVSLTEDPSLGFHPSHDVIRE